MVVAEVRVANKRSVAAKTSDQLHKVVLDEPSITKSKISLGPEATWFGWLLLATVMGFAIQFVPMQFNGEVFMVFYFGAFVGCTVACELFRARESDFFGVPVLVFFSIGFARVFYGLQHEMTRFELLIIAALVGTVWMTMGIRLLFSGDNWLWAVVPGAIAVGLFPVAGLWGVPLAVLIFIVVIVENGSGASGGGLAGGSGGGGGCGGCGGCGG
jgi:hypothetical protein